MCVIPVHLTRKPGTTRRLVTQRVEGNGVPWNEVPKRERPCLQWQLVDSHRTFCLCSAIIGRSSGTVAGRAAATGMRPARATTSSTSRICAQRDEQLVQLLELIGPSTRAPGGDRLVERFLRGIKVVH